MTALPSRTHSPTFAGVGLYRSLWRFSDGSRAVLLAGAGLLIGSQLLRLLLPWFAGQAINVLQAGGPSAAFDAGGWVCGLLAVTAAAWGLHGPGRMLERAVGVRVRRAVSDALFDRLSGAPLNWHDRHPASDLQQRMSQASGALDEFTQNQYVVLHGAVTFAGTLGALVLFSPGIGMVAVCAYTVLVVIGMRFDRSMTILSEQQNDAERRYSSGLLQFVSGIVTVTALRLQPAAKRLLGERLEAIFVPLRRSIRVNEAKWCAVDLLTATLTWGVVALYVWQTYRSGAAVLIGGAYMVYQYADQAGAVVSTAASHLQNFARFRVNYAAAEVIWDAPARPACVETIDRGWTRIELHDIGYRHEVRASAATGPAPAARGIRDVSLTFGRGERIALVGPSGSGKSTLMRVMAGLYDASEGHVTVDGAADAGCVGARPLASIATFIPQDADVFETTALENIAPDGCPDRDALLVALRTSAFDEVVATLSDGLATPITERGVNLSGGQRQRLGLARGVFAAAGRSLILLDEPTSALDPLIEAHVYRQLKANFPTACIVASVHRMSLLEHFDRVVLMADGQVLDAGSVEDVRTRQPLLAAMMAGRIAADECAPQ